MLTADDRWAINETICRHGHLFDEGHLDRLDELFTSDVVYDLTGLGRECLEGIDAIRDAALAFGAGNPLAHVVTNVVVTDAGGSGAGERRTATVRSKAIAVLRDGRCGTATAVDVVREEPAGWRICRRTFLARCEPLGGLGA